MSRKTVNPISILLLILIYLTSCEKPNRVGKVFLIEKNQSTGQTGDLIMYTRSNVDDYFVRKETQISEKRNCVKFQREKYFKLADNVLSIKQNILGQEIWYPYLLLKSGKCISFSEIGHFGTYIITNCTLDFREGNYTIHQVVQPANGEIETESIITLNEQWLPINEKFIKVPFGEELTERIATDRSISEYSMERCK